MSEIEKNQQYQRLELIATKELEGYDQMYLMVDFLNKSLKDKNLIFGLSKKNDTMLISIYTANE